MLEDCSEFKQVQDSFRVFMVLAHLCGAQQNPSFILVSISAKECCLYSKLSLCDLSSSLVTVMVIPVCVWSGTQMLLKDCNTKASRGLWSHVEGWCWILEWALIPCFHECFGLVWAYILYCWAALLWLPQNSCLLSWRQGLGLEKQSLKENTAQSDVGRDESERPWRNQIFLLLYLFLLASLIIGTNFTSVRKLWVVFAFWL